MATPRTGRPRGRPKKATTPKPKGNRGRPPKPFSLDSDRYLIAFFEAHVVALDKDDREAAKIIAAFSVGNEIHVPTEVEAKCPENGVPLAWGQARPKDYGPITNTKGGSKAGTIAGRADSIRKKARAVKKTTDEATAGWLRNMTAAFGVPLGITARGITAEHSQTAKDFVQMLTTEVGEFRIARDVIFPMIDLATGAATMAPDFSLIFVPTTDE